MAQVSQIFGLENGSDLHHLDNSSVMEDSDDEHREDEIKKLLEEGLCNDTFEYDSDASSHNGTKSSNHNNCSFLSNRDGSRNSVNGIRLDVEDNNGLFKAPSNGVNLHLLPNIIHGNESNSLMGNSTNKNGHTDTPNGNGIHSNGSRNSLIKTLFPNSKVNGNTENNQKNREHEEIEVTNPTISLLHKDHCPQNEKEGLGSGIWLSTENTTEQLKTLLDFRERQIQRAEDTIATLTKDKRALNHQIGLMKTEMVRMTSHQEDVEKFAQLKEEEVNYLKTKIREAIEEYEQARRGELASKEESTKLLIEIDKLQQEVRLLSALGSSTQQGEVDAIVRQLREKHAKDIATWQKVVFDLEGQLRTYKRTQQLLRDESFDGIKENVQTQTEFNVEDEIERRERELAVIEFNNEFGGNGEMFLDNIKNLSEREIVKRVRKEWREEKEKIEKHFRKEIAIYSEKLSSLPAELYTMWCKTQEEMGLNKPQIPKPLCRSSATMTEDNMVSIIKSLSNQATSFNLSMIEDIADCASGKNYKEESIQVNYAAVMANLDRKGQGDQVDMNDNETKKPQSSSTLVDEKEVSSVIVQTDETLETYKILASLIDSWVAEVAVNKEKFQAAESRNAVVEEELQKLHNNYKDLQNKVSILKKECKQQADGDKMKYQNLKRHYGMILMTLNGKLALIDQK